MNRLEAAHRVELAVIAEINRHQGWTAEPWGQALLSPELRLALRAQPVSPVRWLPDIAAHRGKRVVFVDAKTSLSHTANYAIEIASLESASEWQRFSRRPVWFVFDNLTAAQPDEIAEKAFRWVRNPTATNGSGTPYLLVAKSDITTHMFAMLDCDR